MPTAMLQLTGNTLSLGGVLDKRKEQKLSSNDRSQTQDISCYYLYVMKCRAPNINTNVLTKQPLVTNVADDIDGKY